MGSHKYRQSAIIIMTFILAENQWDILLRRRFEMDAAP